MKKTLLTIFVLGCFIIYSVHQRKDGSAPVVLPPITSTAKNSQSSITSTPSASNNGSGSSNVATNTYKDGQYTGNAADAYYGYIQVQVTIQNGKLTDVQFLQYPNDRSNSVAINTQAMPYLKQEAIQAQTASVDGVSGATDTSQAFIQSLSSALQKAQA